MALKQNHPILDKIEKVIFK